MSRLTDNKLGQRIKISWIERLLQWWIYSKLSPKTAHATAAAPKTRLACSKYLQGQMQSAKKTMSQSTALFFPILISARCILCWYGLEAQAHGEMNMHVFHLTIMSSLLFSLLMLWFSKMFSLNLDILPMTRFSNNNNKTTKGRRERLSDTRFP